MYFPNTVANDHLALEWLPPPSGLSLITCVIVYYIFSQNIFKGEKKPNTHTKKSPRDSSLNTFDVSTDLWRNVSGVKDLWNTHTCVDTRTLCWQCVLWVPGSSRGLSRCLDIWLLRQIWLIWDGQETGVQRRTDCTRTSPLVRPPPRTVPGLHPARLKTDPSSGIQMVWAVGEQEQRRCCTDLEGDQWLFGYVYFGAPNFQCKCLLLIKNNCP